jgi:adenylate kinase
MHIIMYGPEGSGKGTQAKLLSEALRIPIVTAGDLVREAAANDKGRIGDLCREILKEGKYVPDDDMNLLFERKIVEAGADSSWIMDGFPRSVSQAEFLDKKLIELGTKIDAVLCLNISETESLRRLIARARPLHPGSTELHDSPDRIRERLNEYNVRQEGVLDFYRKKGVLFTIDAEKTVEDVRKDIMNTLHIT